MNVQSELLHWIKERESVRIKKEAGEPKPWTTDPIIRDYKFCNVRRNDDRVSRWIHDHWLHPYADHSNITFAMCVARIFNWPETLALIEEIVFAEGWYPDLMRNVLKEYRDQGNKVFTGAYTVSTCGLAMDKVDYVIDKVFTPLRWIVNPMDDHVTLEMVWAKLCEFQGFSSFMAGQVIADLKYIEPLKSAPDWNTFAPLGPGSIRGLNRLHGRALAYNVKQQQGTQELLEIQSIIKRELALDIALHDVQNCMCEFDKYMRLKYDGGKVRSKYPGR